MIRSPGRLMALASMLMLGACADGSRAVSVSNEDYAVAYDYNDFRTATDGKEFPVLIAGRPFAGLTTEETARRLLPVLQANKPRPRLTFVLQATGTYRLVLVFDPASGATAGRVCKGDTGSGPHVAGQVTVFAVYCRNDLALSQAIGRTSAASPEDPAVGRLFRDVFQTVFADGQMNQPNQSYPGGLQ